MNRKRILPILLSFILLLAPYHTVSATEDISVIVNGSPLVSDAAPYIQDGSVMAPMRSIFEALGADVSWRPETRQIIANKGGTVIGLTIDDTNAIVNSSAVALNVPASIIGGRTYVPIRFISESLSASVYWNDFERTVLIYEGLQDVYDETNSFVQYKIAVAGGNQLGFGEQFDQNGFMLYCGKLRDYVYEGIGTRYWQNGDVYEGPFENGNIVGHGRLTYGTGDVYNGVFAASVRKGTGTFTWVNGDSYVGTWDNDKMDGNGVYKFKNGDIYNGEWKENTMHGDGGYIFFDGRIFTGTWNHGVITAGSYL